MDFAPSPKVVELREKLAEREVWARAERTLRRMVSDYNPTMVAISYRIFRWLWNRLYRKRHVNPAGLDQLKEILRKHPALLVPCHKSHMDYLIISALFYKNRLSPPHIVAG